MLLTEDAEKFNKAFSVELKLATFTLAGYIMAANDLNGGVIAMTRIRTVTHGEYEILQALLDSELIAESLKALKYQMVPENDEVAENRWASSVASIALYMHNMSQRRLHRLLRTTLIIGRRNDMDANYPVSYDSDEAPKTREDLGLD